MEIAKIGESQKEEKSKSKSLISISALLFSYEKVKEILHCETDEQMVDFACLCGNDYTKHFMNDTQLDFYKRLGLKLPEPTNLRYKTAKIKAIIKLFRDNSQKERETFAGKEDKEDQEKENQNEEEGSKSKSNNSNGQEKGILGFFSSVIRRSSQTQEQTPSELENEKDIKSTTSFSTSLTSTNTTTSSNNNSLLLPEYASSIVNSPTFNKAFTDSTIDNIVQSNLLDAWKFSFSVYFLMGPSTSTSTCGSTLTSAQNKYNAKQSVTPMSEIYHELVRKVEEDVQKGNKSVNYLNNLKVLITATQEGGNICNTNTLYMYLAREGNTGTSAG